MSEHDFQLRMQVEYSQPDNAIAAIQVQKYLDGGWQDFALDNLSPGFEIFVYSMFSCQHTYFRLNAAEQGVDMARAHARIELGADAQWMIEHLRLEFQARVSAGSPSDDITAYIVERMHQCPVSKNTRGVQDAIVKLSFDL